MMPEGQRAALRAIRDCGVVRFAFEDDNLLALNVRGLIYATYVPNRGFCFDWRLTDAGKRSAAAIFGM